MRKSENNVMPEDRTNVRQPKYRRDRSTHSKASSYRVEVDVGTRRASRRTMKRK